MNLFRSEEHAENWQGFAAVGRAGIISLADLLTIFSIPYFTQRLNGDFIARMKEYHHKMTTVLKEIGKRNPLWALKPSN